MEKDEDNLVSHLSSEVDSKEKEEDKNIVHNSSAPSILSSQLPSETTPSQVPSENPPSQVPSEITPSQLFSENAHSQVPSENAPSQLPPKNSMKCEQCGKFFIGQSRLKQHMKVCGNDYTCETCGKVFKRSNYKSSSTFRHSSARHRKTCPLGKRNWKKPHYCEICGKMAGYYIEYLKRHMKSCSADRVCHTCERIFKSANRLQNHRCKGKSQRDWGMEQVISMVECEVEINQDPQ